MEVGREVGNATKKIYRKMESNKIDLEQKIEESASFDNIDPEELIGFKLPIDDINIFLDFEIALTNDEGNVEKMVSVHGILFIQ